MSVPKRRRVPGLEQLPESIQTAIAEHYDLRKQVTDEVSNFVEVKEVADLATQYLLDTQLRVASARYSLNASSPQPGGTLFAASTPDRLYLQAVPDDGPTPPLHEFNTREKGRAPAYRNGYWVEHFDDGIHVVMRRLRSYRSHGRDCVDVYDWAAGVHCDYNLILGENKGFPQALRAMNARLPSNAADPLDVSGEEDHPDTMAPIQTVVVIPHSESSIVEVDLAIPLRLLGRSGSTGALIISGKHPLDYKLSARQETVRCPDGQVRRVDVVRLTRERAVERGASSIPFVEADVYVDTTRPNEKATVWVRVTKPAPARAAIGEDVAWREIAPRDESFEGDRKEWVGMLRAIYLSCAGASLLY
jgi:hypothetical protein